ncbi:DUF6165 family protein [Marinicella sp. S1101]|uniref:DUF6165 family protein n=1 Tax=Marinicella marina TaxID=2996016 RepID=UPI002260CB7F|nr:DUF6165 family protein [Marinicella marina]MCX7553491.1 DUF6165 family protein [Marinicella marina]MDJ1140115.1 DUF6165 family protein [Marinicella marina]
MSLVSTPMSVGELLDKITILEIKSVKISDIDKLKNINYELQLLNETWLKTGLKSGKTDELKQQLKDVNLKLWKIEDDIRIYEKNNNFGDEFVALARSVYYQNDDRAAIKKAINLATGSDLVEEKSYESYD